MHFPKSIPVPECLVGVRKPHIEADSATLLSAKVRFAIGRWLILTGLAFALFTAHANANEYSITASSVAPASVYNGQRREILKVIFTNPPAGGVQDIRWSSLGLRMQDSASTPMTAAAAANLVAALEVYKDSNASGAFEPATDIPVASILYLPLDSDGSFSLDLGQSDPTDLTIASGAAAAYFVVVRLTDSASTSTPSAFKLAHLANGLNASTAADASNGAAIVADPDSDVFSSVVQAVSNSTPTTSGIANVTVIEPVQPSSIPLFPSFADAEDADSNLTFTVVANTNPSISSAVGIDPTTGVLTIAHNPDATGATQISVQATDTVGNSVTSDFTLTLSPITTYPEFASYAFGGTGPGTEPLSDFGERGVKNQLKYAFFLTKPGDDKNLPQFSRTGSTLILSYIKPNYATDLTYTHEVSTNLTTWTNAVENQDFYRNVTDLGDGSSRVDLLLLTGGDLAFIRVQVDLSAGSSAFSSPGGAPLEGPTDAALITATAASGGPSQDGPLVIFPTETIVADDSGPSHQIYPYAIATADFDGDGLKDIVVGSRGDNRISWYRNLGGNGGFGAQTLISNSVATIENLTTADVDGDGNIDVVSASSNDGKFAWYRNLGGGSFGPQVLVAPQSLSTDRACAIAVGDLNGDGRMDMICAGRAELLPKRPSNRLAWYPGLAGGGFGSEQEISLPPSSTSALAVGDFDQDGLRDIAAASLNSGAVYIYRQAPAGVFTRSTVYSDSALRTVGMAVADIDGDGWMDIVSTASFGTLVRYSRNNHNNTFTTTNIASGISNPPNGVACGDFDKDGEVDVCVAIGLRYGQSSGSRLVWYRNLGGGSFGNPASNETVISTASVDAVEPYTVAVADFNNDTAPDIACGWLSTGLISAYYNNNIATPSSQVALSSISTAPATIVEGLRDDVLAVTVTSQIASGGNDVQLATLGLLFEKSPGVSMTTAEANSLIETLHLYADSNGSGIFEPALDKAISSTFYLTPTAGKLAIPLTYASPASVRVPPQASRKFFVVPELKLTASSQSPNTFLITHIGEGAGQSIVKDAGTGTSLATDPTAVDSPSSLVTAVANFAPVAGVIPSITVFDTSSGKEVLLTGYFTDTEDGASGLAYSLVGNSNPALLASVAIDAGKRKLAITFLPGVAGTTTLTVRARDSLGKSVSTSFQVTSALAKTYSAWSQTYYGNSAAGSLGTSNLQSYAFGLIPQAGDTSGLPRLQKTGSVWVLTHRKHKWTTDLLYSYEFSTDLINWESGVNGTHFYEFTKPLADGFVQSDIVLFGNWPRLFVRPSASLLP